MSRPIRTACLNVFRPAAALLVLAVVFSATLRADDEERRLLFAQRDAVQAFDTTTGKGFQTGTTNGLISGTSFVSFQFTIVGGPGPDGALPITFNNKVI